MMKVAYTVYTVSSLQYKLFLTALLALTRQSTEQIQKYPGLNRGIFSLKNETDFVSYL